MTEQTTSIDSLPVTQVENQPSVVQQSDEQPPSTQENIKLEYHENKKVPSIQAVQNTREEETKNMNSFVTGLQNASSAGVLQLPNRDIPQQQAHIVQDEKANQDYIPEANDYIDKFQTNDDIIKKNTIKKNQQEDLDNMYNVLHTPILVGLLFFIFQLPILKKTLYSILPFMFKKDGNLNLTGYIGHSVLFAATYFIIHKALQQLN